MPPLRISGTPTSSQSPATRTGHTVLFWPLSVWTVVYLVHYLIVKCMIIEDEWIEDRTLNIAYNAYDHIANIRKKTEAKAKRPNTDANKIQ